MGREAAEVWAVQVVWGGVAYGDLKAVALVRDEHAGCIASTGFAVIRPAAELHAGYLADQLFIDQIKQQAVQREDLRQAAKANSQDNYTTSQPAQMGLRG